MSLLMIATFPPSLCVGGILYMLFRIFVLVCVCLIQGNIQGHVIDLFYQEGNGQTG